MELADKRAFSVNSFDSGRTLLSALRQLGLVLLFAGFGLGGAPADAAAPICESLFSRQAALAGPQSIASAPVSAASKSGLSLLQAAIESDYSSFPKRSIWLRYPRQEPQTQVLVDALLNLGKDDRKAALEILQKYPPQDPNLRESLALALFNEKSWNQFFDRFTSAPLLNESLVNSLVPVLRRMPDDLRDSLYRRINKIYPSLSKKNFSVLPPRLELRLAPKRAVDAFIQHTSRSDEMIANAYARSGDGKQAYSVYLKFLRERIFDGLENGNYQVDDVLTVGRAIQTVLRQKGGEFDDPVVWITGSMPNGRAKIALSDLDSQLSDLGLEKLFTDMDNAINTMMKARHPQANLHVEAMRETTTPHFAAQINPVFLRISRDSVEIEVYSPFAPLNRDTTLMPFNYAKPTRYVLEVSRSKSNVVPLRAAKGKESLPALPFIEQTIRGGYADLPKKSTWMDNPYREANTQSLVERTLQLSPAERVKVLSLLRQSPPKDKSLQRILKLAVFDRQEWDAYFNEFSTQAQDNDALYNALAPVMARMPAELSTHLLARARAVYNQASRVKSVREFPFFRKRYLKLAPKRALDVLIAHLLNPAERFRELLSKRSSVLDAYEAVLKEQKQLVFDGLPQGAYEAKDVLTAAREIQKVIKEKHGGGAEWSVTLAGSFPSGRAKIATSDIDVMVSDKSFESDLPLMTERVNAALRKAGPRMKDANLEVHAMFDTTTSVNAAIVSPILVRVTADRIELMVYDPIKARERDDYQLPENYPSPDFYILESNAAGATIGFHAPLRLLSA